MLGTDLTPIRLGISSCLLGEEVRFDGGHKREAFLVETFGRYVEWVPVCPEVEIGLGIPRDPIRLERDSRSVRLLNPKTGTDLTRTMRTYAEKRVPALAGENLCGYVLKKDSPSCGMERVRVYDTHGAPSRSGRGLFADALLRHYPGLPVEEEGRLCDPRIRENFVERVFAYRRVRSLFSGRWTVDDLVRFHTAHKLQLLSHSPKVYGNLGRLVAAARKLPREKVCTRYETEFMQALGAMATAGRHANVLLHILGYFKTELDSDSRNEVLSLITDYRSRLIPLVVPLTLIRHYVRRLNVPYLRDQVYLDPHPKELMLRNHV